MTDLTIFDDIDRLGLALKSALLRTGSSGSIGEPHRRAALGALRMDMSGTRRKIII
jgi:hypothetical protein